MRINISLVLLSVLSIFISNSESAIIKGTKSEPEIEPENCNEEATTENSKDAGTTMLKRCARPSTVGASNSEPILSMTRRDLSEKRIQQCEACMNRKLCKEHNLCALCKSLCNGVSTTTTTITPLVADNQQTARPEEKREIAEVSPQTTNNIQSQNVVLESRFKGDEDVKASRYFSLASIEPGPVMEILARIFNIPQNFQQFIILGKMKGTEDGNVNNVVIIDLAQAFGNEKKIQADLHQIEDDSNINVNLVGNLNDKINKAIRNKMEENGTQQLNKDEIQRIIQQMLKELSGTVGSTLEETTSLEPETETRCNLDKAVEDIIEVLPAAHDEVVKPKPNPIVEPSNYQSQDSSEEDILNPPVIQDNYSRKNTNEKVNLVGDKLEDDNEEKTANDFVGEPVDEEGYIDDNEEAKPIAATEAETPDEGQKPTQKENDLDNNIVGDGVLTVSDDPKPLPSSDNQINQPKVPERPQSQLGDLEKSVAQIVENSLKTATEGENIAQNIRQNSEENLVESQAPTQENPEINLIESQGPIQEEEPQPAFVAEKAKPSQANSENVVKVYENPQPQKTPNLQEHESASNINANILEEPKTEQVRPIIPTSTSFPRLDPSNYDDPNLLPTVTDVENIVEMTPSNLENRAQFPGEEISQDKTNYFGSLIPAKDIPTAVADPRIRKVYYNGKNINLPLKLFQDENGVIQLRVDTEALCNCKNQNCTKKHLEDAFKIRERTNEEPIEELPELKVRFWRDDERNNDLMDSFMGSLHNHNENLDIFKRSPVDFEDKKNDQSELENEIQKLNEDIERYNEANKQLLNKGTVALYKEVQKAKDVDRMVSLASDLLTWMKDFALKNLNS